MDYNIAVLERWNKEKEYEDTLVKNLTYYFLDSLDSITDITADEREKLRKQLNIIKFDSIRHREMFNNLIQIVMNDGKDNF